MRRRIFLCYSPDDHDQADAFRLQWSGELVATLESGSRLEDEQALETLETAQTRPAERPKVTVVLIGAATADDRTVMGEVVRSLAQGDGVIGICLGPNVKVPDAFHNAGCEVLDFGSLEVPDACQRASLAIRRAPAIVEAATSAASCDDECARAPTAVVQSDHVPVPE